MPEHPTTDNHDFARPEPGTLENEWGDVINQELIDLLEERVAIVDDDADLTNYEEYDGGLFIAADTGDVYIGTGTALSHSGIIADGEQTQRKIWVSESGTPAGADDDDIVLIEASE